MSSRAPEAFRSSYLNYEQLTAQLRAWADEYPALVRLDAIGVSGGGRDIWMVTVGRDLDRVRPTVWVDGNMHACELAGSSVSLAIVSDLLALHAGTLELPAAIRDRVLDVPFCVVPRISPDGAEVFLESGQYVRSVPRDDRSARSHAHWQRGDVDGNGLALMMRVRDSGGSFVDSPDHPGLMLPRRVEDPGPYFKIYPEGVIENFDGDTVPSPTFLSDNRTDLNRNFPYSWAPEHLQVGAGAYPGSEPEARAVVEAAAARPQLFAWINYHCFGGVFIRPLGEQPDSKMNSQDLALFREIGAWAEQYTGYPMVSGYEEFTYEPEKPIRGDLSDFAYHQRGCVAYVVELWDLFARLGKPRPKRFVEYYDNLTHDDLLKLAVWDREHNHGRIFRPWQPFQHPQLGDVEVGGVDMRVGMWNPPYEELDAVCRAQSEVVLRVAALAPALDLDVSREQAGDTTTLTVTVENHGYLGTHVLESSRDLEHNEPPALLIELDGPELVGGARRQTLGHLDGWGRGRGKGTGMPAHLPDRGSTHRKRVHLAFRGHGRVTARAGSCRVGWLDTVVEI